MKGHICCLPSGWPSQYFTPSDAAVHVHLTVYQCAKIVLRGSSVRRVCVTWRHIFIIYIVHCQHTQIFYILDNGIYNAVSDLR